MLDCFIRQQIFFGMRLIFGVNRNMRKITLKVIPELIREYVIEKYSAELLAKKYKVDPKTIINYLKKSQISIRNPNKRKTLNDDYFKKINTEAKAYFLGLLYADGCVFDKKGRSKQLSINLQEKDKYILEVFKKELDYSGNLRRVRYKNNKYQDAFVLCISSNTLCNDLIKLGCVPRKSLILEWPTQKQVSEKFINHFIRGYFDGDGHISFTGIHDNTPQHAMGLCGSKDFLTGLSNYLNSILGIPKRNIKNRGKISISSYGGNRICQKIFTYLYRGATVFLLRKRSKFLFEIPFDQ